MANENLANRQLLEQYRQGIGELERTPDHDINCELGGPLKRAVILMMRYHQMQLAEELDGGRCQRKFANALRVAIIAAIVAASLNPTVWEVVGKLFGASSS